MAANVDDHHETKMMKPEGYPSSDDEEMEVSTSTTSESIWNRLLFSTHNDTSQQESGLLQLQLQGNMKDMGDNYFRFHGKHGEPVDPRLLSLRKFSRNISRLHDEISELLQKFGLAISRDPSEIGSNEGSDDAEEFEHWLAANTV